MKLQIHFPNINISKIVTEHFYQLTKLYPSEKQIEYDFKYFEDAKNIFKIKLVIFRKIKTKASLGWNYYAFPSNGKDNTIGLWDSKSNNGDGEWVDYNILDLPKSAIFDLQYSIVYFEKYITPKSIPKKKHKYFSTATTTTDGFYFYDYGN